MKVIFMGTPDFAVSVLRAVAEHHQVVCVYTQPPRPAGKGYQMRPSAVQECAEELGIPVRCPVSLKNATAQQEFADLHADVAVVCAYGLILPQPILDAPMHGCINVHASLLPRWRGAAPIQRAIQSGDAQSGVTIMNMDAGLDTGDMLMKGIVHITDTMTAGDLHDALAKMGAELMVKTLADLDKIVPEKQPVEGVTYAEKIQKSESLINWSENAEQIQRNIRAFMPVPGAYFMHGTDRVKVLQADVDCGDYPQSSAGTVVSEMPLVVACGQGYLKLNILQRAGKKSMNADDFQKGKTIYLGESLAV